MDKLNCLKCGHKWKKRGKLMPKYCPLCHNPNWNLKSHKDLIELMMG